jgi:peptidoglycan/xylan/chitin deacetylase (PgdA/CDA1 family)
MTGRPFPVVVRVAVLLCWTATATSCGGSTPEPPPPVRITIDGLTQELPAGSTFRSAVERFHLHADDGRLLSVSGHVLEADADPGRVLVNGARATPARPLHQGDAIRVVDGQDRTEELRRIKAILPKATVANPERTLTEYRMREITVEGRISGELLGVREVPIGHGHAPRAVALTFDDGPWPEHTQRVLAVLKRFHVRATFFMVGLQVERYPDLVRDVELAGHEIGNHSYDHPVDPPLADLTEHRITAEMTDTNEILARDGSRPTLFRPPGGSYDDFVVQEARLQGMRVVLWSVDPKDWRAGRTSKEIVKKVLNSVEAGSVVLLHDGGGDAEHTIRALPKLIKGIRKKGLGFVTLPP